MGDDKTKDQLRQSQYDGIQEYDNDLPRWWLFTFFLTIVFALVYWTHYYVFETGASQTQEYDRAVTAHKKYYGNRNKENVTLSDASLLELVSNQASLADGSKIYKTNCVACHGQLGEGGIGPNLTDEYWIHGSKPLQMHAIITNGVLDKGMIAWKTVLTGDQINNVTAYLTTLIGTNPPNPKAPEGKKE